MSQNPESGLSGNFTLFSTLHRIVPENIASGFSYPKIEKTVPQFLIKEQCTRLLRQFNAAKWVRGSSNVKIKKIDYSSKRLGFRRYLKAFVGLSFRLCHLCSFLYDLSLGAGCRCWLMSRQRPQASGAHTRMHPFRWAFSEHVQQLRTLFL